MKRTLLGTLVVAVFLTAFVVREIFIRRQTRQSYAALLVGENIRDIPWPERETVWVNCGDNSDVFLSRDDWASIAAGRKIPPEACGKMLFRIHGNVPESAYYTLEFDGKWNIAKVGPISFREM